MKLDRYTHTHPGTKPVRRSEHDDTPSNLLLLGNPCRLVLTAGSLIILPGKSFLLLSQIRTVCSGRGTIFNRVPGFLEALWHFLLLWNCTQRIFQKPTASEEPASTRQLCQCAQEVRRLRGSSPFMQSVTSFPQSHVWSLVFHLKASLVTQLVKKSTCNMETPVRSLGPG